MPQALCERTLHVTSFNVYNDLLKEKKKKKKTTTTTKREERLSHLSKVLQLVSFQVRFQTWSAWIRAHVPNHYAMFPLPWTQRVSFPKTRAPTLVKNDHFLKAKRPQSSALSPLIRQWVGRNQVHTTFWNTFPWGQGVEGCEEQVIKLSILFNFH